MNDPGGGPRRHFADAIDVRPLDVNDIASVRRLQISSFLALAASDLSDAEAAAFQAFVVSPPYTDERFRATERGTLLGALHDGRLIGTVEWRRAQNTSRGAQIRGIFVDPLFTGCGVGTRLLCDVERDISRAAFDEVATRTTLSSVGFFEHCNYRITAHGQRQLSPSQALALTFLRKTLDPRTRSRADD